MASQRELVAHLRIQLSEEEGGFEMYEIREREVPEQLVLTEQRHVHVGDLAAWLSDAIDRVYRSAGERGGTAGDVFVVYHGEVNEDSDGPVEVCVPISRGQELPKDMSASVVVAVRSILNPDKLAHLRSG